MTKQRGHSHSNLNGYYRARVTQKFKWTQRWCKNQVVARARPWTTVQSRWIPDRRPRRRNDYFRIAKPSALRGNEARKNFEKKTARDSSSHVWSVENQHEETTHGGTTFSRSDIGERLVGESIFERICEAKPIVSPSPAREPATETTGIFTPTGRGNSPGSAIFREVQPSRDLRDGRRVACRARASAHSDSRRSRPFIGRGLEVKRAIRGVHSYCRAIASVYALIRAAVLYLAQSRRDSPRNLAHPPRKLHLRIPVNTN